MLTPRREASLKLKVNFEQLFSSFDKMKKDKNIIFLTCFYSWTYLFHNVIVRFSSCDFADGKDYKKEG